MARTRPADHASRVLAWRHVALAAFALLVLTTQVLWLSFAAITTRTAEHLGTSEGAVGDLAVVNAAAFVLLAVPAGRWMDRSYERALAAGALFTAVGAIVRALDPSSYGMILTGQVVMSIGQPLVLSALTKVAARHFPPREQTGAISVAAGAQYAGILVAVMTSAWLVDTGGFALLLVSHAVLATVAAAAVLVTLRLPSHPTDAQRAPLGWLRSDRLVWKMAALLFLGFGAYNAIATWLDAILVDVGHPGLAGPVIAAMTGAGIVGAAVLPSLAARHDARRPVALLATGTLAVVMVLLATTQPVWLVHAGFIVVGFMLMGTLPVVLDWSEAHVGPARAGTVTAVLLLAGNLGAVLVVLTVQIAIGHPSAALAVMAAWAVPGLVVAALLPRHAAPHRAMADPLD